MTILVPILGDQLSASLASLRDADRETTVVLMMEVADETTYVRHHKAKIVLVLSAMRHFAAALEQAGWRVDYIRLDDPASSGSFTGEVARAIERHRPDRIRVVEPGEYRVREAMRGWQAAFGVPVEILDDDRFFCSLPDFFTWAAAQNGRLTMENFYRLMRRRTGLLIQPDGKPTGAKWNFDHDNRGGPPKEDPPGPLRFEPDAITREVIALVEQRFAGHFGSTASFALPVTATQAHALLADFIATRLPRFGQHQDAMLEGADYIFHAGISTSLNCGLLLPHEACEAAEAAYHSGHAPLAAVEGFIRQILGWREYIRGMYWREMPGLTDENFLGATGDLPEFYWTGDTAMACLADAVRNTRDNAYAHHIQRLMVLGNFAMLIGVEPRQVADWFLVVYADAYEWVEHPNVIGMSQFADGGRLATKPYAASGAYIDRMSNHCKTCRFDVKQKVGPDACPFNALYWDFLARNEGKLGNNPRLFNSYGTWRRMTEERREALRASAAETLAALEPAAPGWARAL